MDLAANQCRDAWQWDQAGLERSLAIQRGEWRGEWRGRLAHACREVSQAESCTTQSTAEC